ncbi:hypothetical protein [Azospirillum argentinense]|uniref:hypothetical protein n=1 Tax=Azospirillum argentinense TaxID=2970906 RepID=UPI0010BF87A1|nr:hypothetical protein [Azospirillum argentinense]
MKNTGKFVDSFLSIFQTNKIIGIHRTDIDDVYDRYIYGYRVFVWRSLALISIGGLFSSILFYIFPHYRILLAKLMLTYADAFDIILSGPESIIQHYAYTNLSVYAELSAILFLIFIIKIAFSFILATRFLSSVPSVAFFDLLTHGGKYRTASGTLINISIFVFFVPMFYLFLTNPISIDFGFMGTLFGPIYLIINFYFISWAFYYWFALGVSGFKSLCDLMRT